MIAQFQFHGDDAPRVGFVDRRAPRFHIDAARIALTLAATSKFVERNPQVNDVVQVHGIQQALDNRVVRASWLTVLFANAARTQCGINRWPRRAHQHIRGARGGGEFVTQTSASNCGVRLQQGGRQRKGIFGITERVLLADRAFHDGRQSSDLIAGFGDRTHTGQTSQQVKDGTRQAIVIDDWASTRSDGVGKIDGDGHRLHIKRALGFWQIIPVGVGVDANGILRGGLGAVVDDVEGLGRQLHGRVSDGVPMPLQAWGLAQEFLCGFRITQA